MIMTDALYIAVGWATYFTLHSLLASNWLKDHVQAISPLFFRRYRLLYNAIAGSGLIYMLWTLATTPSQLLFHANRFLQFLALALATWGLVLIKISFKQYDIRAFLGLREDNLEGQGLSSGGILRYVRHPIYSGTLLFVLGFFLFNPKLLNLVTLACVSVYILIGMRLEERKLIEQFGDAYREYRKEVPALIPRLPF